MPKELRHHVVPIRQFHRRESEGEVASEVKVILVGYCDIAIRRFQIFRNFFFEWIQFRDPIDGAGVDGNVGPMLHGRGKAHKVEGRREIFVFHSYHDSTFGSGSVWPAPNSKRQTRRARCRAPPIV